MVTQPNNIRILYAMSDMKIAIKTPITKSKTKKDMKSAWANLRGFIIMQSSIISSCAFFDMLADLFCIYHIIRQAHLSSGFPPGRSEYAFL